MRAHVRLACRAASRMSVAAILSGRRRHAASIDSAVRAAAGADDTCAPHRSRLDSRRDPDRRAALRERQSGVL